MIILGIDPGTRNMGYCLLKLECEKFSLIEAGVLKFKQDELKVQIAQLSESLESVISAHNIDEVAIEDIFFAHNPKSVLKLAQFRGALSLKIILSIGNYFEYTPLQVKKAITGNGKATKEQVEFMVRRLLNIKKAIRPYDISDAMAVAITHAQRVKFSGVLKREGERSK